MNFFQNNKFKYFISWPLRKHKVKSFVSGRTIAARPEQVRKLGEVFSAAQDMPWPSQDAKFKAEQCIYIGFCLAVHKVGDFDDQLMSQDPTNLALLFGTMYLTKP